jgi:hypothetical protein
MGARHLLAVAGILASVNCSAAVADEARPWTTSMGVVSNTMLRLHWIRPYEGFDTVTRIDAIRGSKVVRTFRISGQPAFNRTKTLVAFPDCWDGGCSTEIQVLDLVALKELAPIRFERE